MKEKSTTIISGTTECKVAKSDDITIVDGEVYINGRKRPVKRKGDNGQIIVVIAGNVEHLTVCGAEAIEVIGNVDEIEVQNTVNEIKLSESAEGRIPTVKCDEIHGDINSSIVIDGSVRIDGNVNSGKITTESSITIEGNASGTINANSVKAQSVSGDITGIIDTYELNAASVTGLVIAGTGLHIGGDVKGIAIAGTGLDIEGDVFGSVFAGTGVGVAKNCTGQIYTHKSTPEGSEKDRAELMAGAEILGHIVRNCPMAKIPHKEKSLVKTLEMIEMTRKKAPWTE